MSKSQPAWDTPARLDGLPCTNWKKRAGVTLDGTLADCVARWVSLADQQKRNCTLGWGPNEDGEHGRWGAVAIGAFVLANGLPPKMATERGGQPAREVLQRLTEMRRYEAPPGPGRPAGDGKSGPSVRR